MASVLEAIQHAADLYNDKKYDESAYVCRKILEQVPTHSDSWRILGVMAREAGRHEESVEHLQRAVDAAEDNATFHFELGVSYNEAGQVPKALVQFQRAAELKPDMAVAHSNVGGILEMYGRYEESLPWNLKAAELSPNSCRILYNLGNVQLAMGDLDAALKSYQRAIEIDPEYALAHWNIAIVYLLRGDFANGWQEQEWRVPSGKVHIDEYPYPTWKGESLAGKTLLVHAEQGIGDEILMASCYRELIEQAEHCVFSCEPRLVELYKRSFPTASVHGVLRIKGKTPGPLPEKIDLAIAAGSIPLHLRSSIEDFPNQPHHLVADKDQVHGWREKLEQRGPGLKIGISWRTGGAATSHQKRATDLAQWGPLLTLPGTQWINLQYGDCAQELADVKAMHGVTIHDWDEADPLIDLDGFAAKLSACDLIISVGNATAHLAGSLGKTCWTLLPKAPTWRWGSAGRTSPWYSSVLNFRQEVRNDWSNVFKTLTAELCRTLQINPSIPSVSREAVVKKKQHSIGPDGNPFQVTKMKEYIVCAHRLQTENKQDEAEALYRQILEHFPRHEGALRMLGSMELSSGRYEAALRSIRRSLAVAPDHPPTVLMQGMALLMLKRYEEAEPHLLRTIEMIPEMVEAHNFLGTALLGMDRVDEAIVCYRQAIEIKPSFVEAHTNLQKALQAKEQTHFPVPHFNQGTTIFASRPVAPPAPLN